MPVITKLKRAVQTTYRTATSADESYTFHTGRLFVRILSARGIKDDEWHEWGKADPYVIWELGGGDFGRQYRTKTHKDAGSDPVWDETCNFLIKRQHPEYNQLNATIWNKNSRPRKDNLLGELTILNMGNLLRGNKNRMPPTWYPVFYNGGARGEILLAFDFVTMSAEAALADSEEMGTGGVVREDDGGSSTANSVGTWAQVIFSAAQVGLAIAAL